MGGGGFRWSYWKGGFAYFIKGKITIAGNDSSVKTKRIGGRGRFLKFEYLTTPEYSGDISKRYLKVEWLGKRQSKKNKKNKKIHRRGQKMSSVVRKGRRKKQRNSIIIWV